MVSDIESMSRVSGKVNNRERSGMEIKALKHPSLWWRFFMQNDFTGRVQFRGRMETADT